MAQGAAEVKKYEWWRDEVSSLRTGMRIRSWYMQNGLVAGMQPAAHVEVIEPGFLVDRIETRASDGYVRVVAVSDHDPMPLVSGWMKPDYPVLMGAEQTARDRVEMAWWRASDYVRGVIAGFVARKGIGR